MNELNDDLWDLIEQIKEVEAEKYEGMSTVEVLMLYQQAYNLLYNIMFTNLEKRIFKDKPNGKKEGRND